MVKGKKANGALMDWVKFIKKVQKEEKLTYKDAMGRAKTRKDKGEKWRQHGGDYDEELVVEEVPQPSMEGEEVIDVVGGRRGRKTRRGGSRGPLTQGGRRGRKSRRGGRKSRRTRRA